MPTGPKRKDAWTGHYNHHEPMDIPFAAINAMAIVSFFYTQAYDDVSFRQDEKVF